MLGDNKVIATTFVSEERKVKDGRKNYAVKLHDMHYSPALVATLMKRTGNVACAMDIIQIIENSQKGCSPTACERERERDHLREA